MLPIPSFPFTLISVSLLFNPASEKRRNSVSLEIMKHILLSVCAVALVGLSMVGASEQQFTTPKEMRDKRSPDDDLPICGPGSPPPCMPPPGPPPNGFTPPMSGYAGIVSKVSKRAAQVQSGQEAGGAGMGIGTGMGAAVGGMADIGSSIATGVANGMADMAKAAGKVISG